MTVEKFEFDGEWVICPHCGYKHGDAWEWVKPEERTMECDGCKKEFKYWAEYEVTYYACAEVEEEDPCTPPTAA